MYVCEIKITRIFVCIHVIITRIIVRLQKINDSEKH